MPMHGSVPLPTIPSMPTKTKKRPRVPATPGPQASQRHRVPKPPAHAKARPATRRESSPRRVYVYALAIAVLAGALLIGLSQLSVHRGTKAATPTGPAVTGIAATAALLDGIPQHGNALGSPTAPVRLVEYADMQCPYCARFAVEVLPAIIRDYVRTGKVQLVLNGLAFVGPDSVTALRTAAAAGTEGRMWNVAELLFANQGSENAWVNDGLLRSIVTATGANAQRVFAARDSGAVTAQLQSWANDARTASVRGTPSFFVGHRGGALAAVPLHSVTVDELRTALDGAGALRG
jgi:protein-disulfide isomerase